MQVHCVICTLIIAMWMCIVWFDHSLSASWIPRCIWGEQGEKTEDLAKEKSSSRFIWEKRGNCNGFLPDKKHNAGGEETPPQYFKTLKLVSCYELNKVSLSNSLKILLKWCFFMTTNNANQSVEMSNISVPAWFIWFNRTHRDSNMNTSDWLSKKLSKFQSTEYFPRILVDVFLE